MKKTISVSDRMNVSDITEMLRTPTGSCPPSKWELEAAKEIERLRTALEAIDRHLDNFGFLPEMKARKLARAALRAHQ